MTKAEKAIEVLHRLMAELLVLGRQAEEQRASTEFETLYQRLSRWRERSIPAIKEHVTANEAKRFANIEKIAFVVGNPYKNFTSEVKMFSGFLEALVQELKRNPDFIMNKTEKEPETPTAAIASAAACVGPPLCFIVHGHDHANKLQLQELLREEWDLQSIILSDEASASRTIIQKFEEEAAKANFAFVLLTPDDQIQFKDGHYGQARPNVIFELGWFCGKLGRSKVFLLVKKGTSIHSDLSGVIQIPFIDNVSEAMRPIKRELVKAGIIKDSKAK